MVLIALGAIFDNLVAMSGAKIWSERSISSFPGDFDFILKITELLILYFLL